MKTKLSIVLSLIFIITGIMVNAEGFEYGDNSGFSDLERFSDEHYIIYLTVKSSETK